MNNKLLSLQPKTIIKYLGQVVLIVFSVILGLYLSERIEDKKNEQNAQELFPLYQQTLPNDQFQ